MKKLITITSVVLLLAGQTVYGNILSPDGTYFTDKTIGSVNGESVDHAIRELRTQVDQLTQRVAQLELQNQSLQGSSTDAGVSTRMTNLEARMATVEKAMDGLNQWVRDVFKWVGQILKIKIL